MGDLPEGIGGKGWVLRWVRLHGCFLGPECADSLEVGVVVEIDAILKAAEKELGVVTGACKVARVLGVRGPVTAGQCLSFMQAEVELQEDLAEMVLAEGGAACEREARKRRRYAERLRHYAALLRGAGVTPEPLPGWRKEGMGSGLQV